jgi:ribosome maturation factor RimP
MQVLGNQMILAAANEAGATEKMISIEWKADRIIVTVDVNADESYTGDSFELDDISEEWEDASYEFEDGEDLILELDDDDELASMNFDDEDDDDFEPSNRVDVTKVARTINEYLSRDGEGSLGDRIAQIHEIEVTTPEFDNVLRGERMFQVYKGFEVIVEHWEEKEKKGNNTSEGESTRKKVVTEGKLVGRDMEKNRTTINVKGRNKNIKNELIESVKLPKAKREKGAK